MGLDKTDIVGHLDGAQKAVDYLNLRAAEARVKYGMSADMIRFYARLRDAQQAIDSAKCQAKFAEAMLANVLGG